jgi:hypothetical protein
MPFSLDDDQPPLDPIAAPLSLAQRHDEQPLQLGDESASSGGGVLLARRRRL